MTSKLFLLELSEGAAEKIVASRRPSAVKRGAVFSDAWKLGKEVAGYKDGKDGTPASPIFGKTRYQVFDEIEGLYLAALSALKDGRKDLFEASNERILLLKSELNKRTAANEVARAARKA